MSKKLGQNEKKKQADVIERLILHFDSQILFIISVI
jgi:hypothetical protein